MQASLVSQGFDLMLYGMGTVFVFLLILVALTTLMSAVINRYASEPELPVVKSAAVSNHSAPNNDGQLVAVIGAAIHKYRQKQ